MREKILAVIPARKGSRRIKNKNIKTIDGKPIIYYAIKILKKSKLFSKIIVSTDDTKIAKIAKKYGAEVPFLRPKKISDSKTPTNPVIKHAIRYFKNKKLNFDKVCCFYPTSILTKPSDLKLANKNLKKNLAYIFSATKYDHPIYRSFRIKDNKIKLFDERYEKLRTQDLPVYYHDAGQFYLGWSNSWLNKKSIFKKYSNFIEIPKFRSQDIDDLEDWKNLKILWNIYKSQK